MTWWQWYIVLTLGPFAWWSANLAIGGLLAIVLGSYPAEFKR